MLTRTQYRGELGVASCLESLARGWVAPAGQSSIPKGLCSHSYAMVPPEWPRSTENPLVMGDVGG